MSRATLGAQTIAITGGNGEIMDRVLARSRATLTRDLRSAMRRFGTKAGNAASAVNA
jgi:hypothetical protein